MAVPVIYLVIFFAYALLYFGFLIKDFTITLLSGIMLMVLSVYTFQYGLDIFNQLELVSVGFSAVTFGLGAYVCLRGGLEMYKNM